MASIQKKNEEGTKWLLIVSDGSSGEKRIRQTRIFHGTEKQASKAAILFEEEVKQGRYKAGSKEMKFKAFVEMWAEDYGDKHLAPKTMARYREMLETRILPAIGHLKLDKLKPMVINRLLNDIAESPRRDNRPGKLSAQTVKHHYRCLSAILQDAMEWDVIAENPCARVKPPKVPRARIKVFDENETSAFLTALEGAPLKHRALVWLEFATGLREGEIMGLEWQDIDFDGKTVSVERVSQYLPEKGVFEKDPKTQESRRTLAIPQNVVDLLKQYRAEWNAKKLKKGELWKKSERLFTTWEGRPGHTYWPQKWLTGFLQKNNLPHCSFHSLRHLNVTMQIKAGVPLKQISIRAGHTDIGTTGNIYAEALESVDREAAEKLGEMLENRDAKGKARM